MPGFSDARRRAHFVFFLGGGGGEGVNAGCNILCQQKKILV